MNIHDIQQGTSQQQHQLPSEKASHQSMPRRIDNCKEKEALIKQWKKSGLSKAEFSRSYNLIPEQFYHWTRPTPRKRSSAKPAAQSANRFLAVETEAKKPSSVKKTSNIPTTQSSRTSALSPESSLTSDKPVTIDVIINNSITLKIPLPSKTECIVKLIKDLSCN